MASFLQEFAPIGIDVGAQVINIETKRTAGAIKWRELIESRKKSGG
jgi:hypothetical protein